MLVWKLLLLLVLMGSTVRTNSTRVVLVLILVALMIRGEGVVRARVTCGIKIISQYLILRCSVVLANDILVDIIG